MRVAIDSRVSTSHQVDHQTIEQQLERLTAQVRAHAAEGWVLAPAPVFREMDTAVPCWHAQGATACVTP